MEDEFDKRLKQYYYELEQTAKEISRLHPVDDESLIKKLRGQQKILQESMVKAKNLYDDFLQKLDEIMPEL